MSYSRRARGLRSITVGSTRFRWRFSPRERGSTLAIYGPASGRQPLLVTLRGWQDRWLAFPPQSSNRPTPIGPRFASQAIVRGLALGWQPQQAAPPLHIDYEEGTFSPRSQNGA